MLDRFKWYINVIAIIHPSTYYKHEKTNTVILYRRSRPIATQRIQLNPSNETVQAETLELNEQWLHSLHLYFCIHKAN